eukprot:jgi/Tetstr1/460433/TSEL_005692.t1
MSGTARVRGGGLWVATSPCSLALPLLCATLLLSTVGIAAGEGEGWHRVKEYTDEAAGGGHSPAIRYNHGAVVVGDEMVVSHGYFYNRETSDPEWLYDTWSINLAATQPQWTLIATGIPPAKAYTAYKAGKTPSLPSGRYGVTLSHHRGSLYMFGGTDGGASKHGRTGYEVGYEMDELWQFELRTRKWTLVEARGGYQPTARYLHTAVVLGDSLYVYGGNKDGAGDVAVLDLRTRRWAQLVDEAAGIAAGPGPRLGHTAAAFESSAMRGFVVYGGRRRGASTAKLGGDVWLFDAGASAWAGPLTAVTPGGTPPPAPRVYHAMAALPGGSWQGERSWAALGAVVSLGSVTTPVMSCNTEAWAMWVSANASLVSWSRLPDLPVGHYHHSLVAHGSAVYGFGGHLCSTTKGDHPFYYLNHLEALPVGGLGPPSLASLVAVDPEAAQHDEL